MTNGVEKLVLFDIDGTLVWTAGAGRTAIGQALLEEMGATGPIDGFRFDGKTDPQIVMELMRAADHPQAENEEHVDAVCDRYVGLLVSALEERRQEIKLCPGVSALLEELHGRDDALVGLLTGNLARGAELKLGAAGLDFSRFDLGAYGSDAVARSDLPPIAAERAAPLMGRVPQGEEIVIIGDTPADMTCGNGVGARAIGVTTGWHSREELEAHDAYAVFDDFSDPAPVIDAIYA
jgi:phosphoglycolate phosphatase-like HAD superfamily hydrolase